MVKEKKSLTQTSHLTRMMTEKKMKILLRLKELMMMKKIKNKIVNLRKMMKMIIMRELFNNRSLKTK